MNVLPQDIDVVLNILSEKKWLALDTETTGLKPYHGDRLFSVVIAANDVDAYYFNFNEYEDQDPLPPHCKEKLFNFLRLERKWFLHNAKFDMHILAQEDVRLSGFIHDSMIVGRILNNTRIKGFSLASLLEEIGLKKDSAVEEYIEKTPECRSVVRSLHRKQKETLHHYSLVPFEMMRKYAEMDAIGTYKLGSSQRNELLEIVRMTPPGEVKTSTCYTLEAELLPVVFEMENRGVKIDVDFCLKAAEYELSEEKKAQEKFKEITGQDFVNSAKTFKPIFDGVEEITLTEKGNPQFSSDVLEGYSSPAAKLILEARKHKSSANFYLSFLDFASKRGVIHANFNQTGTTTGRFSSSSPNLQNLTKEEGEELSHEFCVRRAFIPREDYFFAMFDYDQMEYRLMLDAAEATGMIDKILGGLDVHEATAQIAKVSRTDAKKVNFGILYGQGITSLSESLGKPAEEAQQIKSSVLDSEPKMKAWISNTIESAKMRNRTIKNWCGFPLKYDCYTITISEGKQKLVDPSYKAPNGWVQGGCAYVVKKAMIEIHKYLQDKKSKMVMTIHDEIVIEVHNTEVFILPQIKRIMETVYPYKKLPLTTGLEHSFKSLADKIDGCPSP